MNGPTGSNPDEERTGEIPAQPTSQVPAQPGSSTTPAQAGTDAFTGWPPPELPDQGLPHQGFSPPSSAGPDLAEPRGSDAAIPTPPGTAPGFPPPGAVPPGPAPSGYPPPYAFAPGYGYPPPYGGDPGRGAYPPPYGGDPGRGAYPPPYGGDPGQWGQAPWAQSGTPGGWSPAPPKANRRLGITIFATALAALVLAAFAGVMIGHAAWHTTSASTLSPSGTTPSNGSGGFFNPIGSGSPGSGQGSSASGSPADAASIASSVDPGLVDINTLIGYQGYDQAQGAATGMVLTSTGEVLTNNHVVEGATKISVTDIGNNKTYDATVLGYSRSQDVALIQLTDASGLQTVNLGNSSKINVGEGVVAIGNANGAGGTPSYAAGSVTATNESITASDEISGTSEQLSGLVETNADVIAGDSGGSLVNSSGQVIGMDTAGSSGFQFQSSSTQSYAIPINEALNTAKQIKAGTSSSTVHIGSTAFLGVLVGSPDSGSSGSGGFFGNGNTCDSSVTGACIQDVVAGDPAAQAGLTTGDTITSIDGHSVTSDDSLTNALLAERPGASVSVSYVDTSGQQQTTTVTLGSGPPQ